MAGATGAIDLVFLLIAVVAPLSSPSPPSRAVLLLEVAKLFAAVCRSRRRAVASSRSRAAAAIKPS